MSAVQLFVVKALPRKLMCINSRMFTNIFRNCNTRFRSEIITVPSRFYVRGVKPSHYNIHDKENNLLHSSDLPEYEPTKLNETRPSPTGTDSPDSKVSNAHNKTENVKELLENAATFSNVGSDMSLPEDNWLTSPYPKGVKIRDQSQHAFRPSRDPKETSIILFPGQGTQYVGMGRDLLKFHNVREMFDAASEILGYDLKTLCLEGPKEELDKTVYCQPAVFVSSLAAIERLQEERPAAIENCVAAAGFSVGELTALVFAGAITFEDGVRLLKVRAEAMQLASEIIPSGMMVVMYVPDSKLDYACTVAKQWCAKMGVEEPECRIANYLYPHCKVIAGNKEALSFIQKNASDFNLRRLKWLPVSGAFHTNLMQPAVEPFKEALSKVNLQPPVIPVHSNIDGKAYMNEKDILKKLPKQICKPVKWEQTLHVLYERAQGHNFPRTFECGPGKSLLPILKMVNAKAWDSSFSVNA